jgi:putative transposase
VISTALQEPGHDRRSIRLPGYDYRSGGAYFITFCVQDRETILGAVRGGEMLLSVCGQIVHDSWHALPTRWPCVVPDLMAVMPNHVHAILWFDRDDLRGRAADPSLGQVVRAWKSVSAVAINRAAGRSGRVWQRNYYEHIVRDLADLESIRQYIASNPANWSLDEDNPARW